MSRRLESPWRAACWTHSNRGGGLEPRPHPREELAGARRTRLARQMEETPTLSVAHEGPPRPGGDAASPLAASLASADGAGVGLGRLRYSRGVHEGSSSWAGSGRVPPRRAICLTRPVEYHV